VTEDLRIVRFGSFEYRYRDGHLEWRVPGRSWIRDPHSPEAFAAVAALKDRPTIDDQEPAGRC
jgi:hypothetical protein